MTASSLGPAGILPLRTGVVTEDVTGVFPGGRERWRAAPFTSPMTSSDANRSSLFTVSRETLGEVDAVRRYWLHVSLPEVVALTRNRVTAVIVLSGDPLVRGITFSPKTTVDLPAPEHRTSLSMRLTSSASEAVTVE